VWSSTAVGPTASTPAADPDGSAPVADEASYHAASTH